MSLIIVLLLLFSKIVSYLYTGQCIAVYIIIFYNTFSLAEHVDTTLQAIINLVGSAGRITAARDPNALKYI